ncbi:MAG: dihydrodipicolinate reductase [Roseicyclus sp.]
MRNFLAAKALLAASAFPAFADFTKVEDESQFVRLVDGKQLTRPLVSLRVSADGAITGKGAARDVRGEWQWEGGYFCRDLRWGERDLGYNCQRVEVNGQTVRFTADRGSGDSADFSLR